MVAVLGMALPPAQSDVFPSSKKVITPEGPGQGLRSLAGLTDGLLPGGDGLMFAGKRSLIPIDKVLVDVGKRTRNALHDITNSELSDEDLTDVAHTPKPISRSGPVCIVDIDTPQRNNPQACTSYVCDIYRNLREDECRHRPSSCYMEQVQRDINASMRGILVDWMMEVAEEHKLVHETAYLAVMYLDRVLSVVPVPQRQLQLYGLTCVMLASKYEEIYPANIEEYVYLADNAYTKEELKRCERDILHVLKYQLTVPTTRPFLKRCLQAAQGNSKMEFLASYICELSLLDYGMLQFLPSQIAASSVILAQITLNQPVWSSTLSYYTGYNKQELRNCVRSLHRLFSGARKSPLTIITEKYAEHKHKCVSSISTNYSTLPDHFFA